MKVMLDTNAYSEFKRGHEGVAFLLRRAERIHMSAVVIGELLYGFRMGSRFESNLKEMHAFLENPYVSFVPVSMTTADRFSRVASALRRRGTPIPSNDVWIAAQALETGADLVSFDPHFSAIDGLAWVDPSAVG